MTDSQSFTADDTNQPLNHSDMDCRRTCWQLVPLHQHTLQPGQIEVGKGVLESTHHRH